MSLESDIKKVKLLLDKTIASGCTPGEVAAARSAARKILNKHQISLEYVEERKREAEDQQSRKAYSRSGSTYNSPGSYGTYQRTTNYESLYQKVMKLLSDARIETFELRIKLRGAEGEIKFWRRVAILFFISSMISWIFCI